MPNPVILMKLPPANNPPLELGPVTRSSTKPAWVTKGQHPVRVPDGMIPPVFDLNTIETPAEIITRRGAETHWTPPILLGLRARMAERRLENMENEIHRLAASNDVRRFAGWAILRGVGGANGVNYKDPSQPLRPANFVEQRAARVIERINSKRERRNVSRYYRVAPYLVDVSAPGGNKPRLDQPDYDRSGVNRSAAEARHDAAQERMYNRLTGQVDRRDRLMQWIINRPYNRAQSTLARREEQALRLQNLQAAQAAQAQRRAARRRAGSMLRAEATQTLQAGREAVMEQVEANRRAGVALRDETTDTLQAGIDLAQEHIDATRAAGAGLRDETIDTLEAGTEVAHEHIDATRRAGIGLRAETRDTADAGWTTVKVPLVKTRNASVKVATSASKNVLKGTIGATLATQDKADSLRTKVQRTTARAKNKVQQKAKRLTKRSKE